MALHQGSQQYSKDTSADSTYSPAWATRYCSKPSQDYSPAGLTTVYGNMVYDTVASAYVRWSTTNLRGDTGLGYPGPGAYPAGWKAGSYATTYMRQF